VAKYGLTVSMRGGRCGVEVDGIFGGLKAPGKNTAKINGKTLKTINQLVTLFPEMSCLSISWEEAVMAVHI